MTYTYITKQGERITGSLIEIGELLINGDPARGFYGYGHDRLIDNREPWIHLEDDDDTEYPREFSVSEWIEWAAMVEDRHIRDAAHSLSEAILNMPGTRIELNDGPVKRVLPGERMAPAQFRTARELLGWSGPALADALDVRPDTLRRWESGRDPIPYSVPSELANIARYQARECDALADALS